MSFPRSYIQASFWPHLWVFKQAGHSNGNFRFDKELSLIFSVVRPVGTTLFVLGHRIIISGIPTTPTVRKPIIVSSAWRRRNFRASTARSKCCLPPSAYFHTRIIQDAVCGVTG
jgi:hypothetical protein